MVLSPGRASHRSTRKLKCKRVYIVGSTAWSGAGFDSARGRGRDQILRVKNVPDCRHVAASFCMQLHFDGRPDALQNAIIMGFFVVLPVRIELTTSPLPRGCSTTELRQRRAGGEKSRMYVGRKSAAILATSAPEAQARPMHAISLPLLALPGSRSLGP
jgi:hypothetical protein